MSCPKIKSKKHTAAMMPGSYRFVAIAECGWCSNDFQVEADNDAEACSEFISDGVRYVTTDELEGLFCPDCVDLARQNKLEE